jgi:hypothetical protein
VCRLIAVAGKLAILFVQFNHLDQAAPLLVDVVGWSDGALAAGKNPV